MNGLDLFSGIGGISLALREWVRPIAYCEIDTYCQGVLLSRMATNDISKAPVWDDIQTLQGKNIGNVDIIYGGFPCQDISVAGKGKGLEGERSGLFFEIMRLAKEIKPAFLFLENVPAITSRGGLRVVREIASLGYDCRWCIISAASVGALHKRERWFLLAHTKHDGSSTSETRRSIRECATSWKKSDKSKESIGKIERTNCLSSNVADTDNARLEGQWNNHGNADSQPSKQANTSTESKQEERRTWRGSTRQHWPFESREHWQETVSSMGKSSYGLPFHVDKLRALGNSVCPIQAKEAFKILMGIK